MLATASVASLDCIIFSRACFNLVLCCTVRCSTGLGPRSIACPLQSGCVVGSTIQVWVSAFYNAHAQGNAYHTVARTCPPCYEARYYVWSVDYHSRGARAPHAYTHFLFLSSPAQWSTFETADQAPSWVMAAWEKEHQAKSQDVCPEEHAIKANREQEQKFAQQPPCAASCSND